MEHVNVNHVDQQGLALKSNQNKINHTTKFKCDYITHHKATTVSHFKSVDLFQIFRLWCPSFRTSILFSQIDWYFYL